ncbi:DUF262 domain-containing HNH endonuclease family protein [Mesorhizobium sp.]|uniref:DUF262 domain-containing protein n=1 Tax=Mesorhizobium sp. TaxID=1871066 RepID=UPI0025C388B5|nr:DUF262 domain-containing HNH endonuclease family protein [Mesorhizobium sp.]
MPELSPIEAHERVIKQVFSDDYAFEIPAYQRPYAWETDQVRELLNDLLDAMDDPDTSGGVYFLGSIVLIKAPAAAQAKVVDGQQRLTTLTILLSVLRDLTSDPERRLDRGKYIYQKANPDTGAAARHRLLLRERDRDFFHNHIQMAAATTSLPETERLESSQLRLIENATLLRSRLEQMDETRRDQLVAFIIQRCYLVVVAVPTAEAARRIFTVLNARGLDLTATDILKADLLDRAGDEREDALAKRWEAVELELGRDSFVDLFGHIRMIHEREKPRSALETAFADKVPAFRGDAEEFIKNVLEPGADAYGILNDPAEVRQLFGQEASRAVKSLHRIDNKDWVAPALLRLWRRQQGEGPAVARFLIDLERLAYFLFVTRADANERMTRYANVMDEFDPRQERTAPDVGMQLTEAEKADFRTGLDGPLYRKSRVCRPILQRLDEALTAGGAEYDHPIISIEHVLPQTIAPDSEWADLFPNLPERELWTHRLANLVLLTRRINTRASNWSFQRKKDEYFLGQDGAVPFHITQQVREKLSWTVQVLDARQTELLGKLSEVWRLGPAS